MIQPRPRDAGARGDAPDAPRDLSRSHRVTAAEVAATQTYAGRLISIGSSEGSDGVGKVILTGGCVFEDGAVGLTFRYRDRRTGSRRLDPSTTVLIHRSSTP